MIGQLQSAWTQPQPRYQPAAAASVARTRSNRQATRCIIVHVSKVSRLRRNIASRYHVWTCKALQGPNANHQRTHQCMIAMHLSMWPSSSKVVSGLSSILLITLMLFTSRSLTIFAHVFSYSSAPGCPAHFRGRELSMLHRCTCSWTSLQQLWPSCRDIRSLPGLSKSKLSHVCWSAVCEL